MHALYDCRLKACTDTAIVADPRNILLAIGVCVNLVCAKLALTKNLSSTSPVEWLRADVVMMTECILLCWSGNAPACQAEKQSIQLHGAPPRTWVAKGTRPCRRGPDTTAMAAPSVLCRPPHHHREAPPARTQHRMSLCTRVYHACLNNNNSARL